LGIITTASTFDALGAKIDPKRQEIFMLIKVLPFQLGDVKAYPRNCCLFQKPI
jgi:hypothetical protein